MKKVIRGDKEPTHLVAATRAIDAHILKYGDGNKHHPVIYTISYRNKLYQVEVITRRSSVIATLITGARSLTQLTTAA